MSYEFREGITTVKELAFEIILACNAYKGRLISGETLKSYLLRYAYLYPDKLFNGKGKYNPTVEKIIGQRRITLLNVYLEGYQPTLFK